MRPLLKLVPHLKQLPRLHYFRDPPPQAAWVLCKRTIAHHTTQAQAYPQLGAIAAVQERRHQRFCNAVTMAAGSG